MARVLLLSDEDAKGLLWCAQAGGHKVVAAGARERNPIVSLSRKCRRFYSLSGSVDYTELSEPLLEQILKIVEDESIDVVVPSSFESLKFVVHYRERLQARTRLVPLAPLPVIQQLDDKFAFYQFCRRHGIPHPTSCLLNSVEDLALEAFRSLAWPILLKPLLGAGEHGIERFDDLQTLTKHLTGQPESYFPVLAQEWFAGEDIDFNGYAIEGKVAVWSVMKTIPYHGGGQHVRLTRFVHNDRIRDLGHEIVAKSGYTGPLNVDLRIREGDGEVLLIEVNPRFWMRSVACLIDGLNFVDAAIQLTTDRDWRARSRCDEVEWTSSIVGLLEGLARGDRTALHHLRLLSSIQLRYQASEKALGLVARARRVVKR